MLTVRDIQEDALGIVGSCKDSVLLRRLTDAIKLLAGKGDFDLLLGDLDICSYGGCLALPREVDVVMGLSVDGFPVSGRDRWFNYHVNGPGDHSRWRPLAYSAWGFWKDGAQSPVIQDIRTPSKIVAELLNEEDEGVELIVYGYTPEGIWIRTNEDGEWIDGYRVPTVYGDTATEEDAPVFGRVTRVKKARSVGAIKLFSIDISDSTGSLIGLYQYDDINPQFKRIQIPSMCPLYDRDGTAYPHLVRVAYRKRIFQLQTLDDVLPFDNSLAVLEMLRAIKAYGNDDVVLGAGHEATAARLFSEENNRRTAPLMSPIQVSGLNSIVDKSDYLT